MPRTGLSAPEIRAKALDVALEHIRKHGFEKVRLTDVAHDLGVSHAALYAHFENKEALLDAVLEAWLAETTTALEKVCASRKSPRTKLEEWFVVQYEMKRDRALHDPAVYGAFATANASNKPFVRAYMKTRHDQLVALLSALDAPAKHAPLLLDALASFLHPRLILETAQENRLPALLKVLGTLLQGLHIRNPK